ncbi:hypothetical protein HOP50_13g70810 [Chloropicon primus]|uniref:CCDC66 domain-containing protein n=1 Tax=Chloropicon primus TaxID=1764295 RepID=A0A5B8MVD5_9CHLO|nr:hypothetical protein A3770_13p70610 [Chloropicon primus]UPR03751.1 hypothetical protein HOP50_13g70810 [Chloropicon primus]|eukprot:QDZ24543.1 hypothetical protein A3770_13p70610 [Chloropicon primus]
MLSFGQTRTARLAEKERKQKEYKAELERQIEAKKVREQQERAQERQASRELLSVNKQRENMVAPLGVGTSPQRVSPQMLQRQAGQYQYSHPDAGKPVARPVVVPHQDQRRHDEAILQSEIQHSFHESDDAPAYLGGAAPRARESAPQRHDEAILQSEIQHSFHESDDAPAYMGGAANQGSQAMMPRQAHHHQEHRQPPAPQAQDKFQPSETFYKKLEEERRKLAYGEELRQQMKEQKERKERERKFWKFGDDQVSVYSSQQQRHDEQILRNEYKNSFQESADAPAYLRTAHAHAHKHSVNDAKARASAAAKAQAYREQNHYDGQQQDVAKNPGRHDEAILKSEIEHSFQESDDAPAYLRGANLKSPNSDKRQPMVHFRSDYRDMTALEVEQKQKKAAELHEDLRRQMEEKKAAKARERERERQEEARENERIRREQEQLRKQYEGEHNREHKSRRSHAAPFVNLSASNNEPETAGRKGVGGNTPARRASGPHVQNTPGRGANMPDMGTISHPSFSIPEKRKPAAARAPSPVREEARRAEDHSEAAPSRAGLSTPLVEKKIASSVESIKSELIGNQEKVIQVINEQRQALVAETESTRQEMLQMKNMLKEYQDSIHKMEQLHSEQMQMQNVYALMKQSEDEEMVRRSQEERQFDHHHPPVDVDRNPNAETPSWVRQAMKENGRLDLMQSLQAESTLVFPVSEPIAEEPSVPYRSPLRDPHRSPMMRSAVELPLPVVENEAVDLRLDSESNYVAQEEEWQQRQQEPPAYAEPVELVRIPSRNPSVASSAATLNVEELYERNASKLRMLEDLEAVDDVDEIDRKLNQFLSARDDESVSNSLENYNELDYGANLHLKEMMSQPERLSTPCLPAESDWIR